MVAATSPSFINWKKISNFLWAICALAMLPAVAATNNVVHIRFMSEPQKLRVVFDISTPLHYQLHTVKTQLEVTLLDTHLRFPRPDLPHNSLVTNYQYKQQGNDLHFNFDLIKKVDSKIYMLPPADGYGDRLVLELSDAMAESKPLLTALAPAPAKDKPLEVTSKPADLPLAVASSTKPAMHHNKIIVIDPGHGGKDPGAVGPTGYQEKNAVLSIAKILQEILRQQGYQAVLTRDRDFFIPLRQRLAIARRYKPDLFVAVHADAAYSGSSANGASVFALSERGATSEGARWLAVKENQSELVDGVFVDKDPMLRSVLLDLSQTHTIAVSLDMGQSILQQLSKVTHLHYAGVEQAAFVVLKSPDIPSLLIETGYITNPKQEQQLNSPIYQRQLAANIAQGITNYFAHHSQ